MVILERIKTIVEKQFIYDCELSAETRLAEDLGADSLDTMDFIVALEDEFGIQILDQEVSAILTLGDIADYVVKRMEKNHNMN